MPATSAPPPAIEAAAAAFESTPESRAAEHLAEYSFQFEPGAPAPYAVPRPQEGGAWTLAETLQEIRLRGATVVETSRGLRVRHAHRLGALAPAVRRYEPAVRLWLTLGGDRGTPAGGWDDEVDLHRRWLTAPFVPDRDVVDLRPGVSVTDWPRFVASVRDRLEAGPEAPCAGSVRRDLADLFARHAVLDAPAVVGHVPARAA